MTDGTTTSMPEDDAVLAAEFVLGLLDPEAAAEAAARADSDPRFADLVRQWQEDLVPLAMESNEVPPGPAAKAVLMARLFDEAPDHGRNPLRGIFDRWRLGMAAALAAIVVVAALFLFPLDEPGPSHVAELQPEARAFVLTAALSLGDVPQLDLMRIDGPVAPAGRATELWAIPPGGAPVSLGILPEAESWVVSLPPELAGQAADLTLALSDEPEGGSPTGAPTGAVLAATPFSKL